jgi:hypothetical protein
MVAAGEHTSSVNADTAAAMAAVYPVPVTGRGHYFSASRFLSSCERESFSIENRGVHQRCGINDIHSLRNMNVRMRVRHMSVKVTGLAQKLGQLEAVHRDSHSKFWATLKLLGQPCNFCAMARCAGSVGSGSASSGSDGSGRPSPTELTPSGASPARGGSHTPHRVNTMMKLFHWCFSIQNMESP